MEMDLASNFNSKQRYLATASRFYSFLIVFLMLGDVYLVPYISFLSWGLFVLVLASPYFAIKCSPIRFINRQYYPILLFCIYAVSISMISVLCINNSARDIFVRLVREAFFYVIIFAFGNKLFDYKVFKKWLSRFIMLLAAFVILQAIVFYTTGFLIPGLIPDVYINDSGYTGQEMYNHLVRYSNYHGFIKVNGFLCEPAHCAHCFFVYLLILLFDKKKGQAIKMFRPIIISIAMIATMSTNAFLQLALSWLTWLIVEKKKRALQLLGIIIAVFGGLFILISTGAGDRVIFVIERFTKIFTDPDTLSVSASSSMRIMKGVEIYQSLPLIYKIFGIGFGAFDAATASGIISSDTIDLSNEYMSSIAYIFVSSGVIGFILYISYFIGVFKNCGLLGKVLILGLFIMSVGTSIYCTSIYVWMMLIINHNYNINT